MQVSSSDGDCGKTRPHIVKEDTLNILNNRQMQNDAKVLEYRAEMQRLGVAFSQWIFHILCEIVDLLVALQEESVST